MLCGERQHHVFFRHPEQWAALLTDPKPCTQNARNSTLPTEEQLQNCLEVFQKSVKPIAKTVCPEMQDTEASLPKSFQSLASMKRPAPGR